MQGRDVAALLALVEEALVVRQNAVLALERLLAGRYTPAELALVRRRVDGLAAAGGALLTRLERLVPPAPESTPPTV